MKRLLLSLVVAIFCLSRIHQVSAQTGPIGPTPAVVNQQGQMTPERIVALLKSKNLNPQIQQANNPKEQTVVSADLTYDIKGPWTKNYEFRFSPDGIDVSIRLQKAKNLTTEEIVNLYESNSEKDLAFTNKGGEDFYLVLYMKNSISENDLWTHLYRLATRSHATRPLWSGQKAPAASQTPAPVAPPVAPAAPPATANAPEGAPLVAVVKAQLEKFWGLPTPTRKHNYDYKTIRFDAPVKRAFVAVNGQTVQIDTFPITIVCEITKTYYNGEVVKEHKNQNFYFYQDKPGSWTFRFDGNN